MVKKKEKHKKVKANLLPIVRLFCIIVSKKVGKINLMLGRFIFLAIIFVLPLSLSNYISLKKTSSLPVVNVRKFHEQFQSFHFSTI
jgi:hypothetical protein